MATVKIVLRKKKNRDGTYPLAIRITKDRTSSFIHLGKHVKENDWDDIKQRVKKSYRNATRLNNFLVNKLANATDKLLEVETHNDTVSSRALKQNLKSVSCSFSAQSKIYLDDLKKRGQYNRYSADEPRVNRLKEFLKGEDIALQEITPTLLKRFSAYLKGTRNISDRTVVNHLIVIRTIFNQAIKNNSIDRKYYPFGADKVRIKFPDSIKIGLATEDVKLVEETSFAKSHLNHARNLWLISFYFAGMRISDVLRLRWSDFQNKRLYYAMGKNTKVDSMKIHEKAIAILAQYEVDKKSSDDLIFPELKNEDFNDKFRLQQKINSAVKKLNEGLKEICKVIGLNKKLTTHISRHTFGNISGDKIPIRMLQKLYRHSSITTTIGYQANFIYKDTDEALDAVINF